MIVLGFIYIVILLIAWSVLKEKNYVWRALAAIGTISAVIVALFYPSLHEWYQRPVLKVHSPKYSNEYIRWGQRVGGGEFFCYIDIEVQNKGKTVAHNCQPFLTAVAEKKQNQWQMEPNWVPIGLKWILGQSYIGPYPRATEEKNLVPNRPYIFSLGSVKGGRANIVELAYYLSPTGQRDKFPPGEYCFEITIFAANAKMIKKYFYINWKGGFSPDVNEFKKHLIIEVRKQFPLDK